MNVLLDIRNCRSGGGLAIATNFLKYLNYADLTNISVSVYSHKEFNYNVIDTVQVEILIRRRRLIEFLPKKFDKVFVLFGPTLFLTTKPVIQGYANGWCYMNSDLAMKQLSFLERIKVKLRCALSMFILSYWTDEIIMESDYAKNNLEKRLFVGNKAIRIIPNEVSLPEPLSYVSKKNSVNIGFLSSYYRHKNFQYLAEIFSFLPSNFHLHVSLSDDMFDRYFTERDRITNHGYVRDIASFYSEIDIVLSTSLLETVSASMVEAYYYEKPFFALDLDFNRFNAGEAAIYLPVHDARGAANIVVRDVSNQTLMANLKIKGKLRYNLTKSKTGRFNEYLSLMK